MPDRDLEFMFPDDSTDDRGPSYSLTTKQLGVLGSVEDVHIAAINPGAVRGNHFHRVKGELITVVHDGPVSVHWDTGEGTARAARTFSGRGCVSFSAPRGWSHAVRNDGDHVAWIIAASDHPYDASADDETRRDAIRRIVTD